MARYEEQRLGGDVSFFIGEGENAALIGPNGGGKSLLMNYLTGAISIKEASVLHEDGSPVARQKISMLTFRDIYRSGAGSQDNYYQKRWQATENEDSPMVSQVLGPRATERHGQLLDALGIRSLLEKRLIFLSSGELRKLTIVRSLMTEPELLIVDNPYIGLDAPSRQTINDVLANVVKTMGLKVILVISHPKDLPNWVDKVVAVKDKKVEFVGSVDDYRANADLQRSLFPEAYAAEPHVVPDSMRAMDNDDYTEAVTMRNVHVAYGPVTILDKVDWRQMGSAGQEWLGQEHAAELGMRRQSSGLCQRHYALWPPAWHGREHLGHQTTYWLHIARHAHFLSGGHTLFGCCGLGFLRHRGSLP